MDINEKTPRPAGQGEGNKPRDGKKSGGGRHHHHHRGGKNHRPRNPASADQNTPANSGENATREGVNREQGKDGGARNNQSNQNDRNRQNHNQKGNHPSRDGAVADAPKAEGGDHKRRHRGGRRNHRGGGNRPQGDKAQAPKSE